MPLILQIKNIKRNNKMASLIGFEQGTNAPCLVLLNDLIKEVGH
jgi:hypothetical protein